MPRLQQPLGPLEYALLGMLQIAPRHAYELAGQFAPGAHLGAAIHVDLHDLYAALKRLERIEYVEGHTEQSGGRPPRHVYHVRPEGEGALRQWLRSPVRHNREIRLDFVLKLYFGRLLAPSDARALVLDQLATCHGWRVKLEQELHDVGPESFAFLLGQMRRSAIQATINWLQELTTGGQDTPWATPDDPFSL